MKRAPPSLRVGIADPDGYDYVRVTSILRRSYLIGYPHTRESKAGVLPETPLATAPHATQTDPHPNTVAERILKNLEHPTPGGRRSARRPALARRSPDVLPASARRHPDVIDRGTLREQCYPGQPRPAASVTVESGTAGWLDTVTTHLTATPLPKPHNLSRGFVTTDGFYHSS